MYNLHAELTWAAFEFIYLLLCADDDDDNSTRNNE